ncbi:hypothetical protein FA13DRAFT_1649444 [Coprinellus micaceus]|uniref:Uncharacterized protein n=1 Tax=Coprinellus micaceus TaxID=71717 RepID=A0A4Y7SBT5_COPMI|nr:hypothetical protein FA13DRAFT_1649444 [Coprinellus micaceus]
MLLFAILSLAVSLASAQLRFPCSQLVTERFDPLVTPGEVSPHLHQIVGGVSGFRRPHRPLLTLCVTPCVECVSKR